MVKLNKLNELLKRHENAEKYLDNMDIAVEEKEKWLAEYIKLVEEICKLWEELEM